MAPRRVAITEPVHPDVPAALRTGGWDVVEGPAALEGFDAILVRLRVLTVAEVAGARIVAKHGVGVDNIPLAAAREAGTWVTNAPGANSGAVAEQTLMLLLALARDLDGQRAGRLAGVAGIGGLDLVVVGHGASGARVAALAAGLGARVRVVARGAGLAAARAAGHEATDDLHAALRGAGAVSLHVPLTPATRGMVGEAELALMAPGAFVVNCARGGVLDERALAAALEAGQIGGAGLDVTDPEPLPPGHPLARDPRVILTPHAAGLGRASFRAMGMAAAGAILGWGQGRVPAAQVVVAGAPPSAA
ncbi:MAG TPA: NAD(P)-dependent oxidoreductase [Paracoccaceae bacterium]|mgnify:FL=1|nr:NAD(P)-dependent oxidoreductase [Paracoccaceae bacterium]